MDPVRMKTASFWPLWGRNAALLTGRCHLRYCGTPFLAAELGPMVTGIPARSVLTRFLYANRSPLPSKTPRLYPPPPTPKSDGNEDNPCKHLKTACRSG